MINKYYFQVKHAANLNKSTGRNMNSNKQLGTRKCNFYFCPTSKIKFDQMLVIQER